MFKNKKAFATISLIVLILLAVAGVGGYLAFGPKAPRTNPPAVEIPAPNQSSTAATVPPNPTSTGNVLIPPVSVAPTSSAPAPSALASNLKITRPAGGEQWKAGEDYVIRWDGQAFFGTHQGYSFELSLTQGDRGKGVIVNVDNGPMTGANYLWTIPKDTPPGTYEITVVEYQFVPCSPSASSTLCRQWAFRSTSEPFSIIP